jgi:plasmid stabilization system protein ParE
MALKPKPLFISNTAKADYKRILIEIEPLLSQKSFEKFIRKFERFLLQVSFNPRIFGYYLKSRNIRKYSISKYHMVLYRVRKKDVEIITIVYSRQNPSDIKKKLR